MKSFTVFFRVYSARLGKDLSLPIVNQISQMIGSLCFFYLHLFAFQIIVSRFSFPGWSKPEMMVLLFVFEIFTYLAFFLFWNGLNKTARDIDTGSFDAILAKPADPRLITFFRGGGQHNLYCASLGLVYLVVSLITGGIRVTIVGVLGFMLVLPVSLWIIFCLSVAFVSLNFRYGFLPATTDIMYRVQEVYKYPATIFSHILLIALSLLTTVPASMLLVKPLRSDLLITFFATAVLSTLIADVAWKSGLRHYSSASS